MDRRAVALAVLVILAATSVTLGVGVVPVGVAGAGSSGDDAHPVSTSEANLVDTSTETIIADASTADASAAESGGFDRRVVQITVAEDGSATWTFRYKLTLDSEEEVAEFEEYAERVREEETELYSNFREDSRALVDEGESVVGREMNATGFARDAYVQSSLGNDIGIVELTFFWEGFAVVEHERVVMGDVFEGGLYLGTNQDLVVAPGEGLAFAEEPSPPGELSDPDSVADSETVTWSGEQQFTNRRPRVVFHPPQTAEGGETATQETELATTTDPASTTTEPSAAGGGWDATAWAIVVALTLLAMVTAVWLRGDDRLGADGPAPLGSADDNGDDASAPDAVGAGGGSLLSESESESQSESESESGATGTRDADTRGDIVGGSVAESAEGSEAGVRENAGAASTGRQPSVPDEELLSDEDRVVSLLRDHGGRMKQNQIVDETGWSKSKVSVLLSEMADEGHLSKLRVGRENVISLDGYEPAATRSPFEEDEES